MSAGRWFCWGEHYFLAISEKLTTTACPHCKAIGLLVRHGFLRGYEKVSFVWFWSRF